MGSRFVRPDTVRLPLSQGDWISVRRRLTAGEQRQMFARLVKTVSMETDQTVMSAPKVELDTAQVGISTVLAYLLDWSFPEMTIRGESVDVVTTALDGLDPDTYNEILSAITAHEQAMTAERAQEKKQLATASVS